MVLAIQTNSPMTSVCLEARIIAVADVVEAMSSHRPYRAALGIEEALEEIKKNAGAALRSYRSKGLPGDLQRRLRVQ
jgi:hypothetical protein